MISQIRQLLGIAAAVPGDEPHEEGFSGAAREAAAALLYRMVMADFKVNDNETDQVREAVSRLLDAPPNEVAALLEQAETSARESVSLHDFTRVLQRELPPDAKIEVVELLWTVAFADGAIDPQEEFLVRKVAKLLYVDHEDFIAAKQRARAAITGRKAPV